MRGGLRPAQNTRLSPTLFCQTGQRDGLMPGHYRIAVRCWQREPTDADPGKNHVPARFTNPATSGLELHVAPGSGPMVKDWDIRTTSP